MLKLKTHRAAAKRYKVTASGKIERRTRHLTSSSFVVKTVVLLSKEERHESFVKKRSFCGRKLNEKG